MAKSKDLDPTQTEGISKQWERDFGARYRRLKGQVNRYIASLPKDNGVYTTNSGYVFGRDFQATVEFMNFFNREADRIIRGVINRGDDTYLDTSNWMKTYIDPSYLKGLSSSRAELKKQGVSINVLSDSILPSVAITGAAPSIATSAAFSKPIHVSAIQEIYQRDYSWLDDSTDQMSSQVRNTLTTGIQEGQGITKIAKAMNERIDVGYSRARLIARTETARSYQLGTINESISLQEDLGEPLKMEWVATLDSRVRPEHLARHGKAYSLDEAKRLINTSPWNCRCALSPLTDEEVNDPERKAEVAKERKSTQKKIANSLENRQSDKL